MNEKTKGYSELHLIDNAGHAQSRQILGKEKYTEIVEEFLGIVYDNEK